MLWTKSSFRFCTVTDCTAALDFKAINISLDSFVINILRCINIRPVFFLYFRLKQSSVTADENGTKSEWWYTLFMLMRGDVHPHPGPSTVKRIPRCLCNVGLYVTKEY
jgi:hypothetical protein